jgi:peptidoglycan L-alanyl-D-glutamate endopeptidase CwlK
MPNFSARSLGRLATCDPALESLFRQVVREFDCTIICGHRTAREQQALYAQGRTKPGRIVTYKDGVDNLSKHNFYPSLAVDVVPYPVQWSNTDRMYYFAGFVMHTARSMGIQVRWGGDWDNDTQTDDERFIDLPHFEVMA